MWWSGKVIVDVGVAGYGSVPWQTTACSSRWRTSYLRPGGSGRPGTSFSTTASTRPASGCISSTTSLRVGSTTKRCASPSTSSARTGSQPSASRETRTSKVSVTSSPLSTSGSSPSRFRFSRPPTVRILCAFFAFLRVAASSGMKSTFISPSAPFDVTYIRSEPTPRSWSA